MTVLPAVSLADGQTVRVVLDGDGVVIEVGPFDTGRAAPPPLPMPAAVDVHLDWVRERRGHRATVELPLGQMLLALDGEVAAAGIVTAMALACSRSRHAGPGLVTTGPAAIPGLGPTYHPGRPPLVAVLVGDQGPGLVARRSTDPRPAAQARGG